MILSDQTYQILPSAQAARYNSEQLTSLTAWWVFYILGVTEKKNVHKKKAKFHFYILILK